MRLKNLILHLCLLGVLGGQIKAATVEAEGRAFGLHYFSKNL